MMQKSIDGIEKISYLEYTIMFFILCISGNPLFIYTESKFVFVLATIIMFLICLIKGIKLSNTKFFSWVLFSLILFLFQNTILPLTSINADINFIARLYFAFLSVSFFGNRFREVYFKTMVLICAISIPLFLLQINDIRFGYEHDRYLSIGIFNFTRGARNSAMFWEPGAFQGFIMLIPLLYSDKLKELWKNHKKECIILLIALLTTKSTTGYITFAAFIFLTILVNQKIGFAKKSFLITLTIAVSVYAWSQDFIGEKIMKQYEEALDVQHNDVNWDRMGVMVIDFHHISRHPIIGNGFVDESRYGFLAEYMRGVGNGLSGAINMFGIPFFLIYLIGIFKNLRHIPIKNRLLFLFVILLLLSGEYFLNYPLFWSLLFITFPKNENYRSTFNGA